MCVTVTLMDPAETQGRGTVRVQSPNTDINVPVENTGWKRTIAAIEKHTLEIQSFNSSLLYLPPASREWFCWGKTSDFDLKMAFEHFSLGFYPAEICCRILRRIFFLFRKNKDSPSTSWNLKGFQQCSGSRSVYRALLLLWAQLCRWFVAESRVKGLLWSRGKEGEFPYRSRKSILILAWPVMYFSIAKINKAIFVLPLHKPGL